MNVSTQAAPAPMTATGRGTRFAAIDRPATSARRAYAALFAMIERTDVDQRLRCAPRPSFGLTPREDTHCEQFHQVWIVIRIRVRFEKFRDGVRNFIEACPGCSRSP